MTGRLSLPLAVLAALACVPALAQAHSAGQPSGGCQGCHAGGELDFSVTAQPSTFSPGQTVTMTLTVSADSGEQAGAFIEVDAGELAPIGGQGLAAVLAGLTHSGPKNLSGDSVSFQFSYTAPDQPGAVRVNVWSVITNDNNSSSGDQAGDDHADFVYGCEAQTFWRDLDADGFGRANSPRMFCRGPAPEGYATEGTDCNDNDQTAYPGATEYCNGRDDDCDGAIDNDALPIDLYPDADDDGFFGYAEYESGDTMVGCVTLAGWAGDPGDCEPALGDIHPGAEEICNLYDDNCDGRIDEFVRPQCGEGWCRREAPTCDAVTCVPGMPTPEMCNLLDDDCDGLVDNGDDACEAELVCSAGACVSGQAAADDSGGGAGSGGDGVADEGTATDGGAAVPTEGAGGCRAGGADGRGRAWWWLAVLPITPRRRRVRPGVACLPRARATARGSHR